MIDWRDIATAPKCDPPPRPEDEDDARGPTVLLYFPNVDGWGTPFVTTAWWAYPSGYGYPAEGRWVSFYTEAMSSKTAIHEEPSHWAPFEARAPNTSKTENA